MDVGGEHPRQIRKARVGAIHHPVDGALHEVKLGEPRHGSRDEPGELRRHVRGKRAGPADRSGSLEEVQDG